jgi:hypothetical protein
MRMFTALKKILVIVLALLQLVAPLVHAHTSDDLPGAGLHIPGLELYSATQDLPEIQALLRASTNECLTIEIDAGIHYEPADFNIDHLQDEACFLYQDGFSNHQVLLSHQINFSPHRQHLISLAFVLSPLAPRAPPILN